MKLRIKGNSIRLRLTKSEMERFDKEGYIDERTEFSTQNLVYALQQYDGANLSADLENGALTVYMPAALAHEWANSQKVGFEYEHELANGKKLYILIEKDFKCLDENITEDQSDQYDNPLLKHE
ncbi:MAG: hypothetical protein JST70_15250 [Bacteroidetes bacterium]|nr:hypothetical protein [Bacteroidota bacterium]